MLPNQLALDIYQKEQRGEEGEARWKVAWGYLSCWRGVHGDWQTGNSQYTPPSAENLMHDTPGGISEWLLTEFEDKELGIFRIQDATRGSIGSHR